MKKALLVLLLLAVVAGGLFAQLTISGNVQSGLEVVIPNSGDTTFHWYSTDSGSTYRFHLGASYTNEAGTVGYGGALRNNAGSFAIDGGNAWVKLLEKQLHLQVGNGAPGGFSSMGAFDAGNTAADGRFNAVFTPALDGTTFAVGLGISPAASDGTNTFTKATYGAGLKFGLPGTLEARANANFVPDSGVVNAALGINVSALNAASGASGLTGIILDVTLPKLNALEWVGFGPIINLRVANVNGGNFTVGLRGKYFLPIKDGFDSDYWVGLDLGVPLASTVSAAVSVGYEGKSTLPGINADTGTLAGSDRGGLNQSNSGGTDPALIVRPQLTFNLGSGASIITGWSLQALLASEMVMQHAIYGRLVVSF
jgi:hypothetical protein